MSHHEVAQESITLAPIEAKRRPVCRAGRNLLLAATQNEAVHAARSESARNSAHFPITWTTAGITIWLTGTVAYLFCRLVRLVRFHRASAACRPASEEIQRIATELGAPVWRRQSISIARDRRPAFAAGVADRHARRF